MEVVGPIFPPFSLVSEIARFLGVRDGHRNRKSQKSLRFRCAKQATHQDPCFLVGNSEGQDSFFRRRRSMDADLYPMEEAVNA